MIIIITIVLFDNFYRKTEIPNFTGILGGVFQLWKSTREDQMGRFQNGTVVGVSADGDLGRADNHTANAVTPEQVIFHF